MTLQEIFEQLSCGELSQISIGGQEAGVINENNYDRLISHINLGLTALYKRFPLNERRINFPLQPNLETYQLKVADILKIERVYTDSEYELGLNDEADPYSCFTPSLNVLRIPVKLVDGSTSLPDLVKTAGLTVVYRANHPKVVKRVGYFDPKRVLLELPDSHLWPLLMFVVSRIHNPIGMTNEFHAGNSYWAKYEAACQEIETLNLRVDQGSQNTRLQKGGWV